MSVTYEDLYVQGLTIRHSNIWVSSNNKACGAAAQTRAERPTTGDRAEPLRLVLG
jgi:hypothetical protein